MIIIAKNQTANDIYFTNLGVTVPGNDQLVLTDYLYLYEIQSSQQLYDEVENGNIILNDGEQDFDGSGSLNLLSPVFGSRFIYRVSEGESASAITRWRNKLSFVTPSLPAGSYRVSVYFEAKGKIYSQAKIDNTVFLSDFWNEEQWKATSGFIVKDLSAGTHIVRIQYKAQSGTSVGGVTMKTSGISGVNEAEATPIYTARIQRARVELWRVD
jgi:hypothetical protein